MDYSVIIAGLLAAALGKIVELIGYNGSSVTQENLQQVIAIVLQVGGILVAYVSRVRKGDITWYGARKNPNVVLTPVNTVTGRIEPSNG